MDFVTRLLKLLRKHPAVGRVELRGVPRCRAPTPQSDWDFLVETDDLDAARGAPLTGDG